MKHGWLLHIVNDALSPITLEQITYEAEVIKKKANTVVDFITDYHLFSNGMSSCR